jgi:hypothetical protein
MDPQQPPLICKQCCRPIEPNEGLTLGIRQGGDTQDSGWAMEELATFHEPCWEDFQREHHLDFTAPRLHDPDF